MSLQAGPLRGGEEEGVCIVTMGAATPSRLSPPLAHLGACGQVPTRQALGNTGLILGTQRLGQASTYPPTWLSQQ